ncbi:pyridoxal-dependent decarboxylase domain-containing protein 1 isoform X2 [Nilaparvata lugens]|uniref:pyridoxal-dependent decarboxylase domain-containing protein 1 isoform X2 n=1 Tax=Nilaparvata lugens TaxID=108931 RepID=UPI00193DB4DE|nr:pyridoxal-dependent decarboxylase domain-containing protein 1 isoform X2 [Nilaparvata lugens]
MADAGVNIAKVNYEMDEQQNPVLIPTQNALEEIEFQVSQVIGRLEEVAVGRGRRTPPPPSVELPKRSQDEILGHIQDLLQNYEEEAFDSPLTPQTRISMISHAIMVYASCLERTHIQEVSARLTSDTSRWLANIFRMPLHGVCYHDDQMEGTVRIARALLHVKYPRFAEEGYEVLKSKPPVIYTSLAAPLSVIQHICKQLSLPLHCVRGIATMTLFGSQQKMDVAALERQIEEDKTAGRLPLLVLADAGTPIAGHVDNLTRLQEICKSNDVWLHLRGHTLAALAMVSATDSPANIADSLTLPLAYWLCVPGLPSVTLYNLNCQVGSSLGLLESPGKRLIVLPVWCVLQEFGKDGIQTRMQQMFESTELLWRRLVKYPCLRLLSQPPGGEGGVITLADLISKPVNINLLMEVVASTVVFQFIPEGCVDKVPAYYDKLNSWLGQILQRDAAQVPLELCELESSGVVLRYCPFEVGTIITQADVEAFINCLDQQLEILSATVVHKETFQQLVAASPQLRLVELAGWAGLGGVRYLPQGWAAGQDDQLLTDHAKEELNRLNLHLVEKLRVSDAAFSAGEGVDGLACVRFGMVTTDTDVAELLHLFQSVGQKEEESWKFIDTMAEVVIKGIEAATLDLQKESEDKLWQDGILRQVPVFGSLVNWWSPLTKDGGAGIKGRSLDLTAGVVASTENIYRYHMQGSAAGVKEPPQVVTPVAGHSRASSNASQLSSNTVSNPVSP